VDISCSKFAGPRTPSDFAHSFFFYISYIQILLPHNNFPFLQHFGFEALFSLQALGLSAVQDTRFSLAVCVGIRRRYIVVPSLLDMLNSLLWQLFCLSRCLLTMGRRTAYIVVYRSWGPKFKILSFGGIFLVSQDKPRPFRSCIVRVHSSDSES
jgi:hypothetical protein